ncbi:hypothetical protein [Lagierella sp.]|uniref:hypothetical protein n=1 Tax=Lagierella sp. TaxID=2849657 RepID=UPI00261210AA|nr:hypothetical protein [Lagierella sp.]
MTRQQNRPYILISVLQLILIIVGFVFNYFSIKKMGLMRHLVYRNYVLDGLRIKVFLWLVLAALLFSYLLYRNRTKSKINADHVFLVILLIIVGLLFNQVIPRFKYDYYYQSFLFIVVAVLQLIKLSLKAKKSVLH